MLTSTTRTARTARRVPRSGLPGTLGGLMRACHPEPTVVVTALTTALAAASGRDAIGCLLVATAVLTGQLSVGWCNDRVDLRRDIAAGRLDKPLVIGRVQPRTVAFAAGTALVLCVPCSLASGPLAGLAHLAGVGVAWAYNLGLKRTLLSWLPYAAGFGLLPAFVALGLPGRPWPPLWAVAAGTLLGVGAHLTNVLPDIDADLAAGVRGMPQRLGKARIRVLAPLLLFAASAELVLGPPGSAGLVGSAALGLSGIMAAVAVVPLGSLCHSRLPFITTLGMATLSLALLLLRGVRLA